VREKEQQSTIRDCPRRSGTVESWCMLLCTMHFGSLHDAKLRQLRRSRQWFAYLRLAAREFVLCLLAVTESMARVRPPVLCVLCSLCAALWMPRASAFPTGAPVKACGTLSPDPFGHRAQPTPCTNCPFRVRIEGSDKQSENVKEYRYGAEYIGQYTIQILL